MARGGYGLEAEAHMVERIDALPAWTAINLNEKRKNNPGPDLPATRADGRQVTVSVKAAMAGRTTRSAIRSQSTHQTSMRSWT